MISQTNIEPHSLNTYNLPTMTVTVINDLFVAITAEVSPVVPHPHPTSEQIPAGGHAIFDIGGVGVSLTLIKDEDKKSVPLDNVIYASKVFPSEWKALQTIINDLAGTVTAEVLVPGPGGSHVLERRDIPSGTSYTFHLGRIGVDLVAVYQGETRRVPLDGGKQVIYASELFPPANNL